jgi:hypothetical protein
MRQLLLKCTLFSALACCLLAETGSAASAGPAATPAPVLKLPKDGVLGLVAYGYRYAIYETTDAKECPEGFNATQRANYLAQFPTATEQAAQQIRFGYGYGNRGPHGENVFYNPTAASDPIPFKLSQSAIAPGINLDNRVGPHDYVSPEGETGIDNQLNRVLGCVEGVRANGLMWASGYRGVRQNPANRMMFEVSGIDNMQNDAEVVVHMYRGLDPIYVSGTDDPTPGGTQRIDAIRGARYMAVTKGRIVNGILVTDPIDVRWPWQTGHHPANEFSLRGMQLRLKLTPTGADGYVGGFADVESLWRLLAKSYGAGPVADTAQWSPSSLYKALHENADGYPDASGANTAISMALAAQFVSVFIQHQPQTVQTALDTTHVR